MRRNTRCRFQYTISSVTNQPSRMNMQIASTLVPAEKRVLHEPPFCISGSINGGRLRLYTTAYTGEFLLAVYSCSRRAKYRWFYSSVASRYKVSQVQLTRTVFFQSQHNPFPLSLSSSISFYYSLQKNPRTFQAMALVQVPEYAYNASTAGAPIASALSIKQIPA